jgi:membrane associated rhomboid family serine protease
MVLPLGDLEKTQIVPIATYVLIALNVVIYLYQQGQDESFTVAYAATPYEITRNQDLDRPSCCPCPATRTRWTCPAGWICRRRVIPQAPVPFPVWLTLLTAMFLHGSPLHLAGNMLYLWIFGDNVEEVLGAVRYVIIYLACGLAGSLAQIAAHPLSYIPTLGASGAIAGLMGAYLIWFPFNRVRVLLFRVITEVPAVVVIGLWIVLQVWSGLGSIGQLGEVGGVAYLAHIGGAVAGIVVALAVPGPRPGPPRPPPGAGWSDPYTGDPAGPTRPGRPAASPSGAWGRSPPRGALSGRAAAPGPRRWPAGRATRRGRGSGSWTRGGRPSAGR